MAPVAETKPRSLRRAALTLLVKAGLYPSIAQCRMPFKMVEWRELLSRTRVRRTDRILDLGCGIGTQTLIVGRRCGSIVGVDVSEEAIENARSISRNFQGLIETDYVCGTLEDASFAEGSFDKALSFCVIEHIPNADEVLAEIFRVLKPGGELILSADSLEPIEDPDLIERHRVENEVQRYFRSDTLQAALLGAGFGNIEVEPIFCSRYARRLFEAGIRRRFRYRHGGALLTYFRLLLHERLTRERGKGIFLVARCVKPEESCPQASCA